MLLTLILLFMEKNFDELFGELEIHMVKISEWFLHNCYKSSTTKFYLFLSPFFDKTTNIENFNIKCSYAEIFLGVINDNNLSFSEHVTYLCATDNRKLHALSRVSKYISLKKGRILMKSFISSQFSYCSLTWVTHSRGLNKRNSHIQDRALCIVQKTLQAF